jgi:hypothetical protein
MSNISSSAWRKRGIWQTAEAGVLVNQLFLLFIPHSRSIQVSFLFLWKIRAGQYLFLLRLSLLCTPLGWVPNNRMHPKLWSVSLFTQVRYVIVRGNPTHAPRQVLARMTWKNVTAASARFPTTRNEKTKVQLKCGVISKDQGLLPSHLIPFFTIPRHTI